MKEGGQIYPGLPILALAFESQVDDLSASVNLPSDYTGNCTLVADLGRRNRDCIVMTDLQYSFAKCNINRLGRGRPSIFRVH